MEYEVTKVMIDGQECWCVDGNYWSTDLYSEMWVLENAHTVQNCVNCYNCYQCVNCFNCIDCHSCYDCFSCTSCYNCYDLAEAVSVVG